MNGYPIEIKGRIPSKKNSKRAVIVRGRMLMLPSVNHREWHKDASTQLLGKPIFHKITSITIEFYAPDRRTTDLTNKAESLMDLLVDNGVIPDDNWVEVPVLHLAFCGVSKENPRARITIYGEQKEKL